MKKTLLALLTILFSVAIDRVITREQYGSLTRPMLGTSPPTPSVFVPRFPGDKYIDQSGPATMWESKDGSTWVQTNP